MISPAVAKMTGVRHIDAAVHQSERASLVLHGGGKGHAVVSSGGIHVHGPASIGGAGVHVEGENEMFLGRAAIGRGHRVKEQRPRCEIDNGRAGNSQGIDVAARQIGSRHRRAEVALPDSAAICSVERIHVIRFRHDDNHRRAARAVLDIKRLGVKMA